jgi:uncharacterized protein (TIGR02118 family)
VIKVSVLYANGDGKKFDIEYYCAKHIPLVQRLVGSAIKGVAVDHGIAGSIPGVPAPFIAIGHLIFESVEAFQTTFVPNLREIQADVRNYTNAEPLIQLSEVKM